MPDDLATFRAKYRSVRDAIANCERPDWILRLAFDAATDRKAVISYGSIAARILTRTKLRGPTELFVPWPRPLEAVNMWAGNTNAFTRSFDSLRAYGAATVPSVAVAMVFDWFVSVPQFGMGLARVATFLAVLVFAVLLFGNVAKLALALVVRRQVSRLDEKAALLTVLEHLAKGMVLRHGIVPSVAETLRRKLGEVLAHGART